MAFRGAHRKQFGAKQPTRIQHVAAVRSLICGCVDVAALDRLVVADLARRCGKDPREVECWIGAERRARAEASA